MRTHTHVAVQYLLDCVGDVRFYLSVLCEHEAGQQGGALLRGQRTQRVLKQQLCEKELMTADLTCHSTLQLHRSATVDVVQSLQDLWIRSPKYIHITRHVIQHYTVLLRFRKIHDKEKYHRLFP